METGRKEKQNVTEGKKFHDHRIWNEHTGVWLLTNIRSDIMHSKTDIYGQEDQPNKGIPKKSII